jgi:4-hydroxy-tetrahydrodipicolinate reductase
MGRVVCQAVTDDPDMELVAAVDPGFSGMDVMHVTGVKSGNLQFASDIDELKRQDSEVVVDFTVADAAKENMQWCANAGVHAVVGTTGLSSADVDELASIFDASSANCVVAANFAIGAVLMTRFCELAAPFMDGVEIIELHHNNKVDAPSGTAIHTAELIAAAREQSTSGPFQKDPTTTTVIEGSRGGSGPGDIHVHSVRLPGLVAHQQVLFGAVGQSLTIRHDAYDRTSFMPGVLIAVRAVPSRRGLTVGLGQLLGF